MTTTKKAIKLKQTKANQSYEKVYDPQLSIDISLGVAW